MFVTNVQTEERTDDPSRYYILFVKFYSYVCPRPLSNLQYISIASTDQLICLEHIMYVNNARHCHVQCSSCGPHNVKNKSSNVNTIQSTRSYFLKNTRNVFIGISLSSKIKKIKKVKKNRNWNGRQAKKMNLPNVTNGFLCK